MNKTKRQRVDELTDRQSVDSEEAETLVSQAEDMYSNMSQRLSKSTQKSRIEDLLAEFVEDGESVIDAKEKSATIIKNTDEIYSNISDEYIEEISKDDIINYFLQFMKYGIREDKVTESVSSRIASELDVDKQSLLQISSDTDKVAIEELNDDSDVSEGDIVAVEGQVTNLFDTDSMYQMGIIEDNTGDTLFKSFSDNKELELFVEGNSYRISAARVGKYDGDYNLTLSEELTDDITKLDETFSAPSEDTKTIKGRIVSLQNGSGLIKRCPIDDCGRPLDSGSCREHGDVDGEFDLRIKAAIDDGTDTHDIVMNKELTEEFASITLDEAIDLARENFQVSVVSDTIRDRIILDYVRLTGFYIGDNFIVEDVEPVLDFDSEIEDLVVRASSLETGGGAQ